MSANDLDRQMLAIATILHERMMRLSADARSAGLSVLASEIEDVKLELANRITFAVLAAQLRRAKERELGL